MKKLLTLILLSVLLTSCSYSEGDRVGQVVKLSKKGFIFKTWEGELATFSKRKAVINQGTAISNTFEFTVNDDEIATKILKAVDEGKEVRLHYEEQFFLFFWEGDTKYFVTDISVINN